jgi:hypothetical protein
VIGAYLYKEYATEINQHQLSVTCYRMAIDLVEKGGDSPDTTTLEACFLQLALGYDALNLIDEAASSLRNVSNSHSSYFIVSLQLQVSAGGDRLDAAAHAVSQFIPVSSFKDCCKAVTMMFRQAKQHSEASSLLVRYVSEMEQRFPSELEDVYQLAFQIASSLDFERECLVQLMKSAVSKLAGGADQPPPDTVSKKRASLSRIAFGLARKLFDASEFRASKEWAKFASLFAVGAEQAKAFRCLALAQRKDADHTCIDSARQAFDLDQSANSAVNVFLCLLVVGSSQTELLDAVNVLCSVKNCTRSHLSICAEEAANYPEGAASVQQALTTVVQLPENQADPRIETGNVMRALLDSILMVASPSKHEDALQQLQRTLSLLESRGLEAFNSCDDVQYFSNCSWNMGIECFNMEQYHASSTYFVLSARILTKVSPCRFDQIQKSYFAAITTALELTDNDPAFEDTLVLIEELKASQQRQSEQNPAIPPVLCMLELTSLSKLTQRSPAADMKSVIQRAKQLSPPMSSNFLEQMAQIVSGSAGLQSDEKAMLATECLLLARQVLERAPALDFDALSRIVRQTVDYALTKQTALEHIHELIQILSTHPGKYPEAELSLLASKCWNMGHDFVEIDEATKAEPFLSLALQLYNRIDGSAYSELQAEYSEVLSMRDGKSEANQLGGG